MASNGEINRFPWNECVPIFYETLGHVDLREGKQTDGPSVSRLLRRDRNEGSYYSLTALHHPLFINFLRQTINCCKQAPKELGRAAL